MRNRQFLCIPKKEQSTLWIITGLFDRVGLLINLFERGWNVACKKIRPGELFENGKNGVCVTRRSNWEGRTENILVVFQIGSISMTFGKIGWILIRWYLATQIFGAKLQPLLFLKCTVTNMKNKGLQVSEPQKGVKTSTSPCLMCVWVLFGAVSVNTFPSRQLGWLAEKTTTKDTSWSTRRQVHTIHPPDRLCLFKLWSRGQSIGGQIFYQVWGKSLIVHREETFIGGSCLGGEISKAASSVPDNGVRPRTKPFLLLKSLSLLFQQRVTFS